tara:strand:+ start:205 stop:624 length:420 start_codon:yes stop_codon:yes gene_type:complete
MAEKRKQEIINLVMRQTDYNFEMANKKLTEWNGNYLYVIKEYMNPNFQKTVKKIEKKTQNQMIMGEIRDFMDDVTKKYEYRKKKEEFIKNLYIKKIQEMQENKIIIEENQNNDENKILENSNIADNKNNNDDNPETINV